MYDITVLHDMAFSICIYMHAYVYTTTQLGVNWHRLFCFVYFLSITGRIFRRVFILAYFFPMYARGFSILPFWHATSTNVSEIEIVTFARRAASRSVSGRDNPKLQHGTKFIPIIGNGCFL